MLKSARLSFQLSAHNDHHHHRGEKGENPEVEAAVHFVHRLEDKSFKFCTAMQSLTFFITFPTGSLQFVPHFSSFAPLLYVRAKSLSQIHSHLATNYKAFLPLSATNNEAMQTCFSIDLHFCSICGVECHILDGDLARSSQRGQQQPKTIINTIHNNLLDGGIERSAQL